MSDLPKTEEEWADFIYEVCNFTDAEEKAAIVHREVESLRSQLEQDVDVMENEARVTQELREQLVQAKAAMRELLIFEQKKANLSGWSDCTCMGYSRETERAYERGSCVHQMAHHVLSLSDETSK